MRLALGCHKGVIVTCGEDLLDGGGAAVHDARHLARLAHEVPAQVQVHGLLEHVHADGPAWVGSLALCDLPSAIGRELELLYYAMDSQHRMKCRRVVLHPFGKDWEITGSLAPNKQRNLLCFSRVLCHGGEERHLKAFWPMGIQR